MLWEELLHRSLSHVSAEAFVSDFVRRVRLSATLYALATRSGTGAGVVPRPRTVLTLDILYQAFAAHRSRGNPPASKYAIENLSTGCQEEGEEESCTVCQVRAFQNSVAAFEIPAAFEIVWEEGKSCREKERARARERVVHRGRGDGAEREKGSET